MSLIDWTADDITTPECELLFQGAEARVYIVNHGDERILVKQRLLKKYRHPDLDKRLTTKRITQEARCLFKCHKLGIHVPIVYFTDVPQRIIAMQYLSGYTSLRNYLYDYKDNELLTQLAAIVGNLLARMHDNAIIHGDLTTCNLLVKLVENTGSAGDFSVVPIDFGLASVSESSEDKAVDLYVLERAIVSTHANMQFFFGSLMTSYVNTSNEGKATSEKLEEVRARGRKRDMTG